MSTTLIQMTIFIAVSAIFYCFSRLKFGPSHLIEHGCVATAFGLVNLVSSQLGLPGFGMQYGFIPTGYHDAGAGATFMIGLGALLIGLILVAFGAYRLKKRA